jgi:dTDP-glucose pyrophosphorylase
MKHMLITGGAGFIGSHVVRMFVANYLNFVVEIVKNIKSSERGELEITPVNQFYSSLGGLKVEVMIRSFAWLDSGTRNSLINVSNYIRTIEVMARFKNSLFGGHCL